MRVLCVKATFSDLEPSTFNPLPQLLTMFSMGAMKNDATQATAYGTCFRGSLYPWGVNSSDSLSAMSLSQRSVAETMYLQRCIAKGGGG